MAKIPTAEESAQKILAIFVQHFNARAGHVLRGNNFMAVVHDYQLTASDFNQGIEFAVEQAWVETPDENSYRLTQAGFDAA